MTAAAQLPGVDPSALVPVRIRRRPVERWLSLVITLGLLVSVASHLGDLGLAGIARLLPASAGFWLSLTVVYFALPATDWFIFRRLWDLPIDGFPLVVRKRIANELLLSYAGEVDFYIWARQRVGLTSAPFGTIKDVNILSALAGQIVTIALLLASLPLLASAGIGALGWQLWASLALLLGTPLLAFAVRRRLFTLPLADLRWIAGAHAGRLLVSTAALAVAWHLALPDVPVSTWLALATVRLVISRLPLVPGKDLMFAAVVPALMGSAHPVTDLVAAVTALLITTHVVLAVALAVTGLFGWRAR